MFSQAQWKRKQSGQRGLHRMPETRPVDMLCLQNPASAGTFFTLGEKPTFADKTGDRSVIYA